MRGPITYHRRAPGNRRWLGWSVGTVPPPQSGLSTSPTSMHMMFWRARSFNGGLGAWNVDNVNTDPL